LHLPHRCKQQTATGAARAIAGARAEIEKEEVQGAEEGPVYLASPVDSPLPRVNYLLHRCVLSSFHNRFLWA